MAKKTTYEISMLGLAEMWNEKIAVIGFEMEYGHLADYLPARIRHLLCGFGGLWKRRGIGGGLNVRRFMVWFNETLN